jgi:TolA-binding protein
VAGIFLAGCKKAQDKTAEADSILEQVKVKYPGYESLVAKLKESWNKRTPENK